MVHWSRSEVISFKKKNWGMWSTSQTSNSTHSSTISTMMHWEKKGLPFWLKGKRVKLSNLIAVIQLCSMLWYATPYQYIQNTNCGENTGCFSWELSQKNKTKKNSVVKRTRKNFLMSGKLYSETSMSHCNTYNYVFCTENIRIIQKKKKKKPQTKMQFWPMKGHCYWSQKEATESIFGRSGCHINKI